jgi:hypothetical protein
VTTDADGTRGRSFPRYPVYIPTRGRSSSPITIRALNRDGVPFHAVVVPSEAEAYEPVVGAARLLVLPSDDYVLRDSRNWIKDHATAAGHGRHWQIDDNIRIFHRLYRNRRVPCSAALALRACEDFTDRYDRVGISGLNYTGFVAPGCKIPFNVNVHVYSCTLVNNEIPYRWRLIYNDDTDMCLQVLADGWNTILLNAFMAHKIRTMVIRGGNTDVLYQGDGRLRMARALARVWPGVVTVDRRYGRPQHVVDWKRFDAPLRPRDMAAGPGDYGMQLVEKKPVRSDSLRTILD